MIHHCQCLTFRFEPGDHLLGVHAQLDDFECDAASNRFGLLGDIDHAAPAFTDSLQARLQAVPLPGVGVVPVQLIQALPYLLTIFLLAGFVGKSVAPKAIGIPYVKER